jgi:hypothetical protein
VNACAAGKPTAASSTWDFKGEANTILEDVQFDARQALFESDKLQSFAADPGLSWESHADELDLLKGDINDIGSKLCRPEAIRRMVAPWQHPDGQANPEALWLAAYQHDVNNLYDQAKSLTRAFGRLRPAEEARSQSELATLACALTMAIPPAAVGRRTELFR